jgi:hypothetical protein
MREPIIPEDATKDVPESQPSASGAGRRGPPTRIGAMFDDDKRGTGAAFQ